MAKQAALSQKAKFETLAKKSEASQDEKEFDAALKRIAKAPASKPAKKARKPAK